MSDTVYNRIAVLRAERGISRRQLAEAVGVHYQTVGYLERGEYSPGLHLALRIAEFFEVPVEVIFSLRPFPRIGDIRRQLPEPGRPAEPAPPEPESADAPSVNAGSVEAGSVEADSAGAAPRPRTPR